jgi:hypothetical protein
MMLKRRCYGSCLLMAASASAWGLVSQQHRSNRNLALYASSDEDLVDSSGNNRLNSAFSQNEFSRIIHIDRIFQQRGRNNQQRDHEVKIKADATECDSLAKRFELKGINNLEADLVFRPASDALADAAGGGISVEAEGIIGAHLTQTCVRTNEDFEVDVEIPVYAIVRPAASNNEEDRLRALFLQQQQEEKEGQEGGKKKKKNKNKKSKDDVFHENKKTYALTDVFDLQTALQEADFLGDGGAAEVVEDEGIYSLSSQQLDVGELVAQTFWLELDPYPKKPGTDPIQWEISG